MALKKQHVHHNLIVAWANGKKIQFRSLSNGEWNDTEIPLWTDAHQYRIKPEQQPDVVTYAHIGKVGGHGASVSITSEHNWNVTGKPSYTLPANAKLVFDGETNKLKSIELIG